jgi:hypothetical protein
LSLTRELISEDECEDSLVIAQTRSQSQGRFELTALEADVKKALADPPAIFEIWIHKAGLALGHRFIFGEPSQEPQILSMRKESPTTICVHNPMAPFATTRGSRRLMFGCLSGTGHVWSPNRSKTN